MSINFENLDSYEALEEILNWKRTKQKRHKENDRLDVEISRKNHRNGKSYKRKQIY